MAQCKAHTSAGRPCRNSAIKGGAVCTMHGGRAPQVKAAAARRLALVEARGLVERYGTEIDVAPEEAILAMIRTAAGNVMLLQDQVAQLTADVGPGGIAGHTGSTTKHNEAAPHVLVTMYDEERDRLVRYAKVAAEIGLSARLVKLAESQGELIARVFTTALDDPDWGLDKATREAGRRVIGRHLRLVVATPA